MVILLNRSRRFWDILSTISHWAGPIIVNFAFPRVERFFHFSRSGKHWIRIQIRYHKINPQGVLVHVISYRFDFELKLTC